MSAAMLLGAAAAVPPAGSIVPMLGPPRPVLAAPVPGLAGPDTLTSPWGPISQGLRVRFLADTTFVLRNGAMGVEVQFEFLPKKAPAGLTTLLHHPAAGVVTLQFKDRKTGRVHERFRVPPGFPETPGPADYFDLRGILVPQDLTVRLLSPQGEMIPSGDYDVTAVYVNDRALELSPHAQNYAGRLWSGTARSGALRYRLPALPSQDVSFVAYDSVSVSVELPVVTWVWHPPSRRRIAATARPGYAVGHQERAVLLFPSSERDLTLDVTGAIDVRPTAAGNVLQRPGTGTMLPGGVIPFAADSLIGVRLEESLFETSIPPSHNWKPETGDYRVLWSQTKSVPLTTPITR